MADRDGPAGGAAVSDFIDQLRIPLAGDARARSHRPPPRHARGELFLKGPIPFRWLAAAARLPNRALPLGTAIWFIAGMKRSRTVTVPRAILVQMGLSRYTAGRALKRLRDAGLVAVEQAPGRSPVITLLNAPKDIGGLDEE